MLKIVFTNHCVFKILTALAFLLLPATTIRDYKDEWSENDNSVLIPDDEDPAAWVDIPQSFKPMDEQQIKDAWAEIAKELPKMGLVWGQYKLTTPFVINADHAAQLDAHPLPNYDAIIFGEDGSMTVPSTFEVVGWNNWKQMSKIEQLFGILHEMGHLFESETFSAISASVLPDWAAKEKCTLMDAVNAHVVSGVSEELYADLFAAFALTKMFKMDPKEVCAGVRFSRNKVMKEGSAAAAPFGATWSGAHGPADVRAHYVCDFITNLPSSGNKTAPEALKEGFMGLLKPLIQKEVESGGPGVLTLGRPCEEKFKGTCTKDTKYKGPERPYHIFTSHLGGKEYKADEGDETGLLKTWEDYKNEFKAKDCR